jgi:hypothetical protein
MSNQRQLALTWLLYADDHGDRLAPNGYGSAETLQGQRLWVVGDTHLDKPSFTNLSYLLDRDYAAFASYLSAPEIYKCPSDRGTVEINGRELAHRRSYSLNSYFGWSQPPVNLNSSLHWTFQKTSDFAALEPSRLFTFLDVSPGNICHSAFVVHLGQLTGLFYHLPSAEHGGSGVLTFADGRVEGHRWVDPATVHTSREKWIPNHYTLYLPGNADLEWLKSHASALK